METWLLAFIAGCQLLTPLVTAVAWWVTHEWIKELAVNTNSIKDALVKSTAEAQHAIGQEAGRQLAREEAKEESVQPLIETKKPVPVADNRVATASERTAAASERSATAAERSADVVEKK